MDLKLLAVKNDVRLLSVIKSAVGCEVNTNSHRFFNPTIQIMNYIERLKAWGSNAHRSYDEGVKLFEHLARPVQKQQYSAYFAQAQGHVATFDPHFTQLVNCLVRIERQYDIEPHLYPSASDEWEEAIENVAGKLKAEKEEAIERHQEAIESIKSELLAITEDMRDDAESNYDDLQQQLEEHTAAIEQLQKEVEELSKPGIKVVTEGDMPKSIRAKYDRIKEIVPLYSALHHDLTNSELSDEDRQKIAEELCDLDDERRKLWQQIDAWSEGKGELNVETERPQYSDNAVVRGYELARAVKRLKQNIINSQKSAEKAQKDGRQVVYDNAMARIAAYEKELAEIEAEINATDHPDNEAAE